MSQNHSPGNATLLLSIPRPYVVSSIGIYMQKYFLSGILYKHSSEAKHINRKEF